MASLGETPQKYMGESSQTVLFKESKERGLINRSDLFLRDHTAYEEKVYLFLSEANVFKVESGVGQ